MNHLLAGIRVGLRDKANCEGWDLGLLGEYPPWGGGNLSKVFKLVFMRVLEKTAENSERLGRPRI